MVSLVSQLDLLLQVLLAMEMQLKECLLGVCTPVLSESEKG